MKSKPLCMTALLALAFASFPAASQTDTKSTDTKADAQRLKRLNACNKEAKGKTDDAYREAMKACMERKG